MVFSRDGITIHLADCREALQAMEPASVNTCVTSPPYWGLRDYGYDEQLGLEPTPEAYIGAMVDVFREVRRVLRDDGTLWLNIGDSYARNPAKGGSGTFNGRNGRGEGYGAAQSSKAGSSDGGCGRADRPGSRASGVGLKEKDLVGIPWMLAFALRADGWYLRQDIIWHKPNPMPESVRDRCTKAHEYIFLLSKSARYYFNQDAIKIAEVKGAAGSDFHTGKTGKHQLDSGNKSRKPASARGVPVDTDGKTTGAVAGSVPWEGNTANRRTVWTVPTRPYSGAHFAVFPPDLVEPCILAGCPEGGVVLDPFLGSGTTAEVAQRNGCRFVGCEMNPDYFKLATKRFDQRRLFGFDNEQETPARPSQDDGAAEKAG